MKIKKSVKETNESLTVTVLEEESGLFINADFQKNNVYVEDGDEEIKEKIYTLIGGSGGGSNQALDHNDIKRIANIVRNHETKQLMNKLPTSKISDLDFKPVFKKMMKVIKDSQLIFKGGDDS